MLDGHLIKTQEPGENGTLHASYVIAIVNLIERGDEMMRHISKRFFQLGFAALCGSLFLLAGTPVTTVPTAEAQATDYGLRQCTNCGELAYRSPCSNCRDRGSTDQAMRVPEPGTFLLLSTGLGIISIAALRRNRNNR
jgi:hypothetical protein